MGNQRTNDCLYHPLADADNDNAETLLSSLNEEILQQKSSTREGPLLAKGRLNRFDHWNRPVAS